jgi:hypothetical protein
MKFVTILRNSAFIHHKRALLSAKEKYIASTNCSSEFLFCVRQRFSYDFQKKFYFRHCSKCVYISLKELASISLLRRSSNNWSGKIKVLINNTNQSSGPLKLSRRETCKLSTSGLYSMYIVYSLGRNKKENGTRRKEENKRKIKA